MKENSNYEKELRDQLFHIIETRDSYPTDEDYQQAYNYVATELHDIIYQKKLEEECDKLCSSEEKSDNELKLFCYDGPVYIFNKYIENKKIYTTSKNLSKAISNIKYQLKETYKLEKTVPIKIDNKLVKLVEE